MFSVTLGFLVLQALSARAGLARYFPPNAIFCPPKLADFDAPIGFFDIPGVYVFKPVPDNLRMMVSNNRNLLWRKARLIASPSTGSPEKLICTYMLTSGLPNESAMFAAIMEVTTRSKEDVQAGIEALKLVHARNYTSRDTLSYVVASTQLPGHAFGGGQFAGTSEALSWHSRNERTETRIFRPPTVSTILEKTEGWRTYVSANGGLTLDQGKNDIACLRFLDYAAATVTGSYIKYAQTCGIVNVIPSFSNVLFPPQFTLPGAWDGLNLDKMPDVQIDFATWIGSKSGYEYDRNNPQQKYIGEAIFHRLREHNVALYRKTCGCPATLSDIEVPLEFHVRGNLPESLVNQITSPGGLEDIQMAATLIATPDHEPSTRICMYELQASLRSRPPVLVAFMEVTRRSTEEARNGAELLKQLPSLSLDGPFYGIQQVSLHSGHNEQSEIRIFREIFEGVTLHATEGWKTFVSATGGLTLDKGKAPKDCRKFFDYALASMALSSIRFLNHHFVNSLVSL
ncbi:hypothetical protein FRB95_001587 [Tulasnella sp. JGI-2019a]|nr:hypothetical protein FRB95_001587 [Tulasnella sp. JGI-2019a]